MSTTSYTAIQNNFKFITYSICNSFYLIKRRSRSPFDQVKAIADAVGDKLEIILDGGVRRGTHVLKALSAGAKACSFGKMFLFSLAAGGQQGVEHLLKNMYDEINRNMVLMGCKNLKELNNSKLIYRNSYKK